MGKLIVSDLKKLVKCRTVWVCAVISFLVGMLMTFLYDMAWNNMTDTQNYQTVFYFMRTMGMDSDMTKQVLSQFPSQVFWQYVNTLLSDGNIVIFAAVVISVYIGSEYNEGTFKNTLSRGFSRTSVYISKYISSVLAMAITVLSYVFGGGIVAAIKFDLTTDVSDEEMIIMVLAYTVLFIALTAVFMLIATLSKRTGFAIALSIVIPIIVSLIVRILSVGFDWVTNAASYWIFDTVTLVSTLYQNSDIYIPFMVAPIYLVLSLAVGMFAFSRQEIK